MSWPVDVGERIQELADRIVVLRDAYYRGSPAVADAEYDVIEDELRTLIEANPELAPDPNPLDQVGAPVTVEFDPPTGRSPNRADHPGCCGVLANLRPDRGCPTAPAWRP